MDKRIDELCDERNGGGEFFVYLKPGFQMDGAHSFGEATKTDIRTTMSRVKPCNCKECAHVGALHLPVGLGPLARVAQRIMRGGPGGEPVE